MTSEQHGFELWGCFSIISTTVHDLWLVELKNLEPCIQRADYRLYADFQLHGGLAAQTYMFFKGQLYVFNVPSSPQYVSQRNVHTKIYVQMLIAALFVMSKTRNNSCPLAVYWINGLWSVHKLDYCYHKMKQSIDTYSNEDDLDPL